MSRAGDLVEARDVAVWVCVRDHVHTLDAALGSVAAQTARPAEVVVVDLGSTDGSVKAAERWAGRLPLHIVHAAPGQGLPGAFALASEHSTARWLTYLDPSDCLLPDHLTTLASTVVDDSSIVSPRELVWDPAHGAAAPARRARDVPERAAQLHALLGENYVSPHALFSRASYDRTRGIRTDRWDSAAWDLWIRLVRTGAHVVRTNHATVLRRFDPDDSGVGYAESALAVIGLATEEAADESERRCAVASGRRMASRVAVLRAVEQVHERRLWAARRSALDSLRTGDPLAPMAWFMALTPKSAASLHDRRRQETRP